MSNTSRIRDNYRYGKVAEFLRDKIEPGSSLSIVSAYFTIYAFGELRDELMGIEGLRFLFGDPRSIRGIDPSQRESKAFVLSDDGLQISNYLSQSEVAKSCAQWIQEKVEIRTMKRSNFLHGKMYHIAKDDHVSALIGSSNFTVRGLGLSKSANIELNHEVTDLFDCGQLKMWFDHLWESDEVENVKTEVLEILKNAYQDKDPQFIYYKTLYHLFEDFLEGAGDTFFAEDNPRFVETEIWQKLYLFQKHGVQACIQKLNEYNGCIIADSVGLGKTYEALAIIKYFELRNAQVLVLCPRKLEQNWMLYPLHYRRINNNFKADRFRYNVLAHTDLDRERGESNGIDLAQHEWDGYDLIVIDESHNFRNRGMRYHKLLENVIQSGCNTKVLMLSATPVNNQLTDLENQILLITNDKDDAFSGKGISSIKSSLAVAQSRFDTWTKATEQHSDQTQRQQRLAESLNADFFSLLDKLTIARSRRHITEFYRDSIKDIGGFPEHGEPKSVHSKIDRDGKFPSYQAISDQIDGYKLSQFNPSKYIRAEYLPHYRDKRLQQREFNLIGMMKVNFLKRLESSIYSFKETLRRTLENIEKRETEIAAYQTYTAEKESEVRFNPFADVVDENDEDEEQQHAIQAGKDQIYHYKHLDLKSWLVDLSDDKTQLEKLYKIAEHITPDRDAKLIELKDIISQKAKHPTINIDSETNRKILVFTACADTANYLYANLNSWAKSLYNMETAVVTGSGCRHERIGNNFDQILINFSPRSKERKKLETESDLLPEIDLLIATDCISEGQNLQDCDYMVNYDIHWNPVRIIQRFGRIDRIGSRNTKIQLINFWPTQELDDYINLKPRVEARMALANLTATGDDNPLSLQESLEPVWTHRDKQLKQMQQNILDFEDIEEQLNLNQFTLDDFRAQLLNYLRNREDEFKNAPKGLYAVTDQSVPIAPGVIFCLKQVAESEQNKKLNPIYPYYLIHISDEGEVSIGFTNPKRILEVFSALCIGKEEPAHALCQWFNMKTDYGRNMTHYEKLIDAALDSIVAEYNRTINDQLDTAGADFLLPKVSEQVTETTEFELITWLVITG